MKKFVTLALSLFLVANVYAGGGKWIKYEPLKIKDQTKFTKKLIKVKTKDLQRFDIKKIAIVECWGEFLQSKEVSAGAFEQRAGIMGARNLAGAAGTAQWSRISSSKSSIDLGEDYYAYAVDQVFEIVSAVFSENGIEVIPRDEVAANEFYAALELKTEKKTKGYTGAMFKKSVTTKGLRKSATNLGLYPGNMLKAIKLSVKAAKMAHEIDVDAIARVHFYINKGKKGEPVLTKLDVLIDTGKTKTELGFKKNKKISYGFKYQSGNMPVFEMKNALLSTVDIKGEEKGSIDMGKYHNALLELVNVVTDYYKEEMGKALERR